MPAQPQRDGRPNWVRTVADRFASRPLPPEANPFTEGLAQWEALRSWALEAADALRVADDTGRAQALEIDSLRRENERMRVDLGDQLDASRKECRLLQAYATNLRSRFASIREQFERIETEALQFAVHEVRAPRQMTDAEADHTVDEIHDSIRRINPRPGDQEPPSLSSQSRPAAVPPNKF